MRTKKVIGFLFEGEFKVFVILFAFFIVGMVYGCAYYCKSVSYGVQAVDDAIGYAVSGSFISLLIKNLLILLVAFALGYSVIGAPLICFTVIYDGICCGLFCGVFSVSDGFRGSAVATICFFIYYLINTTALFFVSFSSLRMSIALYNVFKSGTRYIPPGEYSKPHILKFVVFSVLTVASSAYYVFGARNLVLLLL